jgi:hypothetical protein
MQRTENGSFEQVVRPGALVPSVRLSAAFRHRRIPNSRSIVTAAIANVPDDDAITIVVSKRAAPVSQVTGT